MNTCRNKSMDYIKVSVSELTGPALSWAVAQCQDRLNILAVPGLYDPAVDWSQGGPIIEREGINLATHGKQWMASIAPQHAPRRSIAYGPTPLIATMRCYVASKLGLTVDIPTSLLEGA